MLRDGEVIGFDLEDGHLIQWDDKEKAAYDSGKTLDQFGIMNLTPDELRIVGNRYLMDSSVVMN